MLLRLHILWYTAIDYGRLAHILTHRRDVAELATAIANIGRAVLDKVLPRRTTAMTYVAHGWEKAGPFILARRSNMTKLATPITDVGRTVLNEMLPSYTTAAADIVRRRYPTGRRCTARRPCTAGERDTSGQYHAARWRYDAGRQYATRRRYTNGRRHACGQWCSVHIEHHWYRRRRKRVN